MPGGPAHRPTLGALLAGLVLTPALLHGTVLQAQELHGDPRAGHELAAELCSGCHLIDDRQGGPVADGVPTFVAIARRLGPDEIELGLLAETHPAMPQPPLDARGRADVIAWFGTLAAH